MISFNFKGDSEIVRAKTGSIDNYTKLSIDPQEKYISVMLAPYSFVVLTNFGSKAECREVGGPVIVPERVGPVVGAELFGANKILIIDRKGTLLIYSIISGQKIRLGYEKNLPLTQSEEVDVFDTFHSGELIVIATRDKASPSGSRLIVQMIDLTKEIEKTLSFSFCENPERYLKTKNKSNFFRIFVNFIYDGHPIIFAFQEAKGGASANLFVGQIEKNEIKEVAYIENIVDGRYIDSAVSDNCLIVLDAQNHLNIIKMSKK